jgi:hypothetical protein
MTLQLCASRCALVAAHDDWDEFDPAPVERWIMDDFDWDDAEPLPDRGDYWDDSLDSQWDLAAANDE